MSSLLRLPADPFCRVPRVPRWQAGLVTTQARTGLTVLQARISSWIAHGRNQANLISDEPQYLAGRGIRVAHLRDDFWQLGVGQDSLRLLFGDYHCMVVL